VRPKANGRLAVIAAFAAAEDRFSQWYDDTSSSNAPLQRNDSQLCRNWQCRKEDDCPNVANAILANGILDFPESCQKGDDPRLQSNAAEPATTLTCHDGRRCGSSRDNSCHTTCDYCVHCRGDASTRTCVYKDMYYDGNTGEFLVKGDFDTFAEPGCLAKLGLGTTSWPVRVVQTLPGPVSHVFTAPVLVGGPLHGAFAHGFLEGLLASFWVGSEIQRQWGDSIEGVGDRASRNATRPLWTLFFDGAQLRHRRANFRRAFHPCTGKPRGGWHGAWYGKILNAKGALYRGSPSLRNKLVRFDTLAVSGLGGRSPWHGLTYASSRPFGGADLEFSRREHATATLHFFSKLSAGISAPAVAAPAVAAPADAVKGRIVILNREEGVGRSLSNPSGILQALRRALPNHTVHLTTPPKVQDYPRGLASLLRSARVLISPHGAQLAHVGLMPRGAAVVEVQTKGCDWNDKQPLDVRRRRSNPMYEYVARYSGLDYAVLHADTGKLCNCHDCKLHVPPSKIVEKVQALLAAATEFEEARRETLRTLWDEPPRRLEDFVQSCDIH